MTTNSRSAAAPLTGVKVLDLTRLLPGPLCGQYLSDLGAEVIKIEDTGAGDYARPAVRRLVNRGKQAIRLNLKTNQGKEIFHKLAKDADIILESFRPGTMQRLGLGYEDLCPLNPRLVYCAISGYGQTGPRRAQAGHDINFLALSGVLSQTGTEDQPVIPGFLIGDLAGGTLSAVSGILAALLGARSTGHGRMVDVSMADSVLAQSVLPIAELNENVPEPPRGAGTHTGGNAHYNVYETQDGRFLSVGAQEKKFWDIFCDALERPDLKDRHTHAVEANVQIKAEIAELIRLRPLKEWEQIFSPLDCCVSPVLSMTEATRDEQFHYRGTINRQGDVLSVGLPFQLSDFAVDYTRSSPSSGEHTQAVLAQLGYSRTDIQCLSENGVI